MNAMTTQVAAHEQAPLKPLVTYFDPASRQEVKPGEFVHDYYGIPVWLMKDYLLSLGAEQCGENLFGFGKCRFALTAAPHKRVGSLEFGGTRVACTGCEGNIQAVLTKLEWKTLRCGG